MAIQPIRVVIADDHPIVRDGVVANLTTGSHVTLVGMATTFAALLNLLPSVAADVVVLDLGGMGGSALTMVMRLRRDYPQLAIVVFSSSVDLAPELLQEGVLGYVVKEELSGQLLDAVYAVHIGERFLSPTVEEYVARAATIRTSTRLAPQELNVLKLLAQGLGTVTISEQLGIDPRSAQNYITALRRKANCASRTQLVDWYKRMFGDGEDSNT